MKDVLLTAIFLFLLGTFTLWKNKKSNDQCFFMGKDYTTILKGFCCIIVILVHIPLVYANKFQDAVGSFAYVCVTLFFLISAYGMSFSRDKKADYMKHFWRNRLVSLLIPQLLINLFAFVIVLLTKKQIDYLKLISVNSYVIVLLEYCVLFFCMHFFRRFVSAKVSNILLALCVITSSFVMYFFVGKSGWCYERCGLIWGLFLYLNFEVVKKWVRPSYLRLACLFLISFGLGVAYLQFKPVFFWGEYLLKIVLGVVLILLLFTSTSKRKFGNPVMFFLGSISYEIYLSHGLVMYTLQCFDFYYSSGSFIIITVFSTILFSAVIHKVGTPLIKFLRK